MKKIVSLLICVILLCGTALAEGIGEVLTPLPACTV